MSTPNGGAHGPPWPAQQPRAVIIGIDGGDWGPIRSLIDRGKMPALARLIDEGVSADLRSLDTLLSPRIWTSIATGKLPIKHGIWGFHCTRGDLRAKRVWDIVREAGGSVGVFQWMATWPPEMDDAFCVPCAPLSPDGRTNPPSLGFLNQLHSMGRRQYSSGGVMLRTGVSVAWNALLSGARLGTLVEIASLLLHRPSRRDGDRLAWYARARCAQTRLNADLLTRLLRRRPPTILAMLISETDMVQHKTWGAGASGDGCPDGEWGDLVEQQYIRADASIGRVLGALPSDATVVVVSDHGFQAESSVRWVHVGRLLDLLQLKGRVEAARPGMGTVYLRPAVDDSGGASVTLDSLREWLERLWITPADTPLFTIDAKPDEIVAHCAAEAWGSAEALGQTVEFRGADRSLPLEELLVEGSPWRGTHRDTGIMVLRGPAFRRGEALADAPLGPRHRANAPPRFGPAGRR